MTSPRVYYVRHGAMSRVCRFSWAGPGPLNRGASVVVRSLRGDELGEVVAEATGSSDLLILRESDAADFSLARQVAGDRSRRLDACDRVFREGEWPLSLIDAEPMLDPDRTVLLYLGPHRLDASGLVAALREATGLEVVLEPVGLDAEPEASEEADPGCGSCGSGGGCGSSCGTGGGCSGCSIKDLVAARRPMVVV